MTDNPRALIVLLVVCLSNSLRAAVIAPVSLSPALRMAESAPAFRASELSQISVINSMSVQPVATLTPIMTAAVTPTNPWNADAARFIGAPAASPRVVARHQNEFDLHDAGAVQERGARLNALFENSKSPLEDASDDTVAALDPATGAAEPAPLQPSAPPPSKNAARVIKANWDFGLRSSAGVDYLRAKETADKLGWLKGENPFLRLGAGAALSKVAGKMLAQAGISVESDGVHAEGLRISAIAGGGPLNNMAARVEKNLGATLRYSPADLRDAGASFSAASRKINLPHFDSGHWGLMTRHELGHAFHTHQLLLKGPGPFNIDVLAHDGRTLPLSGFAYHSYMGFTELPVFAKDLRQTASTEQRGADDGGAQPIKTALQLEQLLATADAVATQARRLLDAGTLKVEELPWELRMKVSLAAFPRGRYHVARLPEADLIFPVETPPSGQPPSETEARASLSAQLAAFDGYRQAAQPLLTEAIRAYKARDIALTTTLAGKLVAVERTALPPAKPNPGDRRPAFIRAWERLKAVGKTLMHKS